MANYHLYVIAVRASDTTADALEGALRATSCGYVAGGPIACNWAPDPDTVADGLGCAYDDIAIHDLNPAIPTEPPVVTDMEPVE